MMCLKSHRRIQLLFSTSVHCCKSLPAFLTWNQGEVDNSFAVCSKVPETNLERLSETESSILMASMQATHSRQGLQIK